MIIEASLNRRKTNPDLSNLNGHPLMEKHMRFMGYVTKGIMDKSPVQANYSKPWSQKVGLNTQHRV